MKNERQKYRLTRLRGNPEHRWQITVNIAENEWWENGPPAQTWDEAKKLRDELNAAMPPRARKK